MPGIEDATGGLSDAGPAGAGRVVAATARSELRYRHKIFALSKPSHQGYVLITAAHATVDQRWLENCHAHDLPVIVVQAHSLTRATYALDHPVRGFTDQRLAVRDRGSPGDVVEV
jgi:hypothetical protein